MMLGVLRGVTRGAKRQIFNPKMGDKNFYKGYGAKSVGSHTRKGHYIVRLCKIPEFVVPDLTGFKLGPYVFQEVSMDKSTRPEIITADTFRRVHMAHKVIEQFIKHTLSPSST